MAAPAKPLDDLAAQIQELMRRVEKLESRTGVRKYAAADRPPAAQMKGAVIFNLTTGKHEGSDGAAWNALY